MYNNLQAGSAVIINGNNHQIRAVVCTASSGGDLCTNLYTQFTSFNELKARSIEERESYKEKEKRDKKQ